MEMGKENERIDRKREGEGKSVGERGNVGGRREDQKTKKERKHQKG